MNFDRLPAHDLQAELSLLGCWMLDPNTIDGSQARPEHFYSEGNGKVAAALLAMREAHRDIDPVTLRIELVSRGDLAEIGGDNQLLRIMEAVPLAAHFRSYSEAVREKYRRRTLQAALSDCLNRTYDPTEETEAIAADAEQRSLAVIGDSVDDWAAKPVSEVMVEAVAIMQAGHGVQRSITTNFSHFDHLTGGWPLARLTIVGGRPSNGKTSFVSRGVLSQLEAGHKVLFVSYETPRVEVFSRLVSLHTRVPLTRIQRGHLDQADAHTVAMGCEHVGGLPLLIQDKPIDEAALSALIRLDVRRRGTEVVVIDYLGLIPPRDRKLPREQQVAGISRTLKLLATDTGAAIVLLSQLNRQSELRENKRPRLADLRESGAIEQDADMVVMVHRPGYGSQNADVVDDHGILDVCKNRNGPCGSVAVGWNGACAEFYDDGSYPQ